MRIRDAQMHIFEDDQRKSFTLSVNTYLRAYHAGRLEGLTDTNIDERIERTLQKAERYGITQAQSLTVFIALAFIVGPEFDQYPAAQMILANREMPPNDKPIALLRRVSTAQWHDAAHRKPVSS